MKSSKTFNLFTTQYIQNSTKDVMSITYFFVNNYEGLLNLLVVMWVGTD